MSLQQKISAAKKELNTLEKQELKYQRLLRTSGNLICLLLVIDVQTKFQTCSLVKGTVSRDFCMLYIVLAGTVISAKDENHGLPFHYKDLNFGKLVRIKAFGLSMLETLIAAC
jgi:hypothetical protein